jgi:hypothetical protein
MPIIHCSKLELINSPTFRKIRFDFMEKNKNGKHLKFAIGEIIYALKK